jgi:hypothetical protein
MCNETGDICSCMDMKEKIKPRTLLDVRLLSLVLQKLIQFLAIRCSEFAYIELRLAVHFSYFLGSICCDLQL